MRRWLALLLCILLVLSACPALADTYYVVTEDGSPLSVRDEATNEVLTTIPYGIPLVPDPNKSTDICAYVTFAGQSGLVLWRYLSRTNPAMLPDAQSPRQADPQPAPSATEAPSLPEGSYQLTAVGALITPVNSKQAGVQEMVVTAQDNVNITAQIPKNAKVDYWVINGVRYDFLKTVRILRMTKFDASFTVEVVFTTTQPETLLSPETIQSARTGEQTAVTTTKCKLSHVKANGHSGGGWIRAFDFTHDYKNRATGEQETGGQMTFRIKADNTGSAPSPVAGTAVKTARTVRGWKFNATEVYPNVNINEFLVHTLNVSMTYEPILGGSSYKYY